MSARVATSSNGSAASASSASATARSGVPAPRAASAPHAETAHELGAHSCLPPPGPRGIRHGEEREPQGVTGEPRPARRPAPSLVPSDNARLPRRRGTRRSTSTSSFRVAEIERRRGPPRDVTHEGGAPAETQQCPRPRDDLARRAFPTGRPGARPEELGELVARQGARPVEHEAGHRQRGLIAVSACSPAGALRWRSRPGTRSASAQPARAARLLHPPDHTASNHRRPRSHP